MPATIVVTPAAGPGGEYAVAFIPQTESEADTELQGAETEAIEGESEEASNPILPTVNEIFWGGLFFLVLWALMKWVFLPPIVRVMKERNDALRADLDAGEHATAQAELAVAEYEASLTSARAEASRIIEDARASADAKRREIITAAEAEVASMRQAAAAEVAEAKAAAMAELRGGVASIAVGAAETVVGKPLDEATQLQVIEDYVNRAGSAS